MSPVIVALRIKARGSADNAFCQPEPSYPVRNGPNLLERSIAMQRVTLVLALALVILTVPQTKVGIAYDAVADGTSDADGKAETAKFQGVWRFDSFVTAGKNMAKEAREKITVKFDEDSFTLRHDGRFTASGTWKLGASKKPKEITLTYTEGDLSGTTLYAIYRWDDDDLVICHGEPRPGKFESDSNHKNALIRLSKLKKK